MTNAADFDACYRAVSSRDARFDGWFVTAVTSTGVYCRPSCPAITPKRQNVRFYATAAAAQGGGFRACKRCRPDATPGSPEWNTRHDLVARAMRLIADGVIDREGVGGLARRLGYSERHLNRQLVAEVGAGPLALARSQRAQTARVLIETTDLPFVDVAFASGFASVRQFNDTVREVFALPPRELRQASRVSRASQAAAATRVETGALTLRLPYREPFDAASVFDFLGYRSVAGVEAYDPANHSYRRTLRLPHGHGAVTLTPAEGHLRAQLHLADLRDLATAVQRCRRLADLDADPVAIAAQLGGDPLLGPIVAACPGRRVPGAVDGTELAVRAVLGQQVSVAGARTLASRIVARCGEPLGVALGPDLAAPLTHTFPTAAALAELTPEDFAMPRARGRTLIGLCRALADGTVSLGPGEDRAALEAELTKLDGIGPWTASYLALRVLGDPDVFLPSDLGVRRALERMGQPATPKAAAELAERWRPWRSYALMHLWSTL